MPRKILVVDDNRDAADSLAQLLRTVGHDVEIAYDAGAAMNAWTGQCSVEASLVQWAGSSQLSPCQCSTGVVPSGANSDF